MQSFEQKGYLWLLSLTAAWILLIISYPLLMHGGFYRIGVFVYTFFSPICHQDPHRSLSLFQFVLPVCERCSSIYFSFFILLLVYPLLHKLSILKNLKLATLVLFLLPMICDYVFDVLGFWKNFPASRMISGSIAGIGLALFIIPAWNQVFIEIFHLSNISPITKRN